MYALAFLALTTGAEPDPQVVAALALAAASRPVCECGCADGKACTCTDCPAHPKPAVGLTLATVQEDYARTAALEARVETLEKQVKALRDANYLGNQRRTWFDPSDGPPRPVGDGWTLDPTRAVWWRPLPADAVQANVAQMAGYSGFTGIPTVRTGFTSFGDDGGGGSCVTNADGSVTCGAGARGGYRFAPFGGRFRLRG